MSFRKLRIAWSVAWGVVAVLLLAWWVQSYWRYNNYHRMDGRQYYAVTLVRGALKFDFGTGSTPPDAAVNFYSSEERYFRLGGDVREPIYWFHVPTAGTLLAPMWFPTLIAILAAVLPWRRSFGWRFSLRALLIATTILAGIFGTTMWLLRLR